MEAVKDKGQKNVVKKEILVLENDGIFSYIMHVDIFDVCLSVCLYDVYIYMSGAVNMFGQVILKWKAAGIETRK